MSDFSSEVLLCEVDCTDKAPFMSSIGRTVTGLCLQHCHLNTSEALDPGVKPMALKDFLYSVFHSAAITARM